MKKAYFSLRRRTIVTPLWLAGLAAAVVVGCSTWLWNTADSTIVIVVRNAESGAGGGADAPLDTEGTLRATRLAMLFGESEPPGRVDAIYVEDSQRARQTAAPLAKRLGLEETVVAGDAARSLARRALRGHAGERVLIVAGRDAIPRIVAAVAGRGRAPAIAETDHGTIFVVGVPRIGRTNVLRLRY